ncbi:hypothetical protein GCM10010182_83060 [Actinomadura cremea]|nr:hypothetical protein GCM10010182_83060 [Actinomadura cremea]
MGDVPGLRAQHDLYGQYVSTIYMVGTCDPDVTTVCVTQMSLEYSVTQIVTRA